ncbi:hypothetical protein BDV39DRAFT_195229 [Aspergillus sergii]|uniref:6-phosphogluconolactonase n=1 Tax=Aspergillus sergii TaxID=1034303 RepID=A0A5N6WTZ6_9EURO|nr:hypothetical protein BDV39DRAFT_195229 [Aspergillus sergii]
MASQSPNLYSFSNSDALAQHLRTYVLKNQNAALARHDTFRVAVSGGSLPTVLAKALLAQGNGTREDTAQFSKWDIFFADERAVPLDHQDSNYKLLKDELLNKIPTELGEPRVHTIDPNHVNDEDPQELADLYQEELMRIFAAKDSVKLPVFDLILLGCGPDGHTCSLFPNHELLREKDAWVAAISDSPKPPPKRITLTLPVVTHAVSIAFVATGGGKKDIMKQIFDAEEGRELPSSLVNQGAGEKVSWFTDHPAVEVKTVSTSTKATAGGTPSNPAASNENASTRSKSLLPPQPDSRIAQRASKPEQDKLSAAPTLASRRRSLIKPTPLKTTPSPAKPTAVSTTSRRTSFAPPPPSPAKQNGRPTSPKKIEMPPPPRPSRSASLRQPASSSSGPPTPRGHTRHRSQTDPPSAPSTPRSRTQFSTYQPQPSPKKLAKPTTATPSASASTELDPSLIPSFSPELSLLHLSSLREDADWKANAEKQLRIKYNTVAEKYRCVVKEEKDYQQRLNGQALHCWLKNSIEHNGHQGFAVQIQVLSEVAQEVFTLAVQDFESWFRNVEEIKTCRHYRGGSDLDVFIDPLDRAWQEEVHALTMKLELCSRQLQSLDIMGYGEVEQLEGSSLYRTAKGLDGMVNSMIEELNTICKIEADVVRSERQWVSQLSQQVVSTRPLEKRIPRVGMWRS